jgi:predicted 2-oxoglutarate/Fe(II)-dependent dioxygenase YbiX
MSAKDSFEKNGFVVLSNVLPQEQCDSLVKHMFDLYLEGKLVKDDQCPLSDSVYGDPIFDDLLQKFAKPIGDHLGKTLLPTYTYCRIYRTGEVLKKHKDRPACEVSATMTLGFDAKHLWKIYFDEQKEIPVDLQTGEMAVYAGCDILHWRPAFKGNWHVQVFFHYVDANGPHADHAVDGRSAFGIDKTKNAKPATKDNKVAFPKPIFNTVTIPSSTDTFFPGYMPISSQNLPELKFSLQECDKILNMLREAYPSTASVGGTVESSRIARGIRSANIYILDNDEENRWIFEKVASVVSFANQYHFGYDLTGIVHGIQLIEYCSDTEVQGHYDWHVDSGNGEPATRKISFTAQLSDPKDYEGCELVINNHGTEVVATKERGSLHLFPSYMTHKVTPITKGTRYALVIWIHGSRRFR